MFKIPQIEKESFYIDQAMKSMQEFAEKERDQIHTRWIKNVSTQRKSKDEINLNKRKDLELAKIRNLNTNINNSMRKLIKRFPNFIKIDEVYIQLINTSDTPTRVIKDSLAMLRIIADTSDDFTQKTEHKIKRARSSETVGFLMKKHLGKQNSLFKKNKHHFHTLNNAAKFMNKLPTFEDLYTTAIAGFPNVGKSTLMQKISGSKVGIQNYPFTTKGLMFSYLKYNGVRAIQLIDTPGLLGRDKNNSIEERAQIVLTEYANSIVFVIDVTESCGFDLQAQLKLLKKINKIQNNIVVYFSKTDIFNEEDREKVDEIKKKNKRFEFFEDHKVLNDKLIEDFLALQKKFDPNKLRLLK